MHRVTRLDDLREQHRGVGIGAQIADKGPIYLQLVNGQAPEIGERRIASPEVVQADGDAHRSQFRECADSFLDVAQEYTFGDFQFEVARGKIRFLQYLSDSVHNPASPELLGRYVYPHANMRKPRILPGLVLRARRSQYPCPDRDVETGLYGDTDKLTRRHQPLRWMPPADQRLDRCHLAGLDVRLRLVVNLKFRAFQRPLQGGFELEPLSGMRVHFRCQELETISSQRFGPVHSGTGVLKKDLRVATVCWENGNTDSGGGVELDVMYDEWVGEDVQ